MAKLALRLVIMARVADAQTFWKPIRLVVSFPPGGDVGFAGIKPE